MWKVVGKKFKRKWSINQTSGCFVKRDNINMQDSHRKWDYRTASKQNLGEITSLNVKGSSHTFKGKNRNNFLFLSMCRFTFFYFKCYERPC